MRGVDAQSKQSVRDSGDLDLKKISIIGDQINIVFLGKTHCTFWIYFFNRSKIIVPIMLLKYSQGEV